MPGTKADVNRPASPSVGRGVNTPGPHRTGIPVSFTRPEYPADPYAHDLTGARGGTRPGPDPTGDPEPADSTGSRSAPSGIAGWRWAIAAGGVAVVAILVIAVLAFRLGAGSGSGAASGGTAGATTSASPTTATTLPVTDVYSLVAPSVVLITTSKGAVGSGVVVTDTGTVLTANHVIVGRRHYHDHLRGRDDLRGDRRHADRTIDIAMLTPPTLPEVVVPATLGGGVAVGSDVVAIGNPLGLVDSTTSGIVSGLEPHDQDRRRHVHRADPVRRRRQPRQLRRAAARRQGPRRGRRGVDRRPRRGRLVRRHRLRRADRGCGGRGRIGPGSRRRTADPAISRESTSASPSTEHRGKDFDDVPALLRRPTSRPGRGLCHGRRFRRQRPHHPVGHQPCHGRRPCNGRRYRGRPWVCGRRQPDRRRLRQPARAGAVRGQAHHRRPGRAAGADGDRAALRRPPARRGRAGTGQDARGQVAGRRDRRPVPAHPVHP